MTLKWEQVTRLQHLGDPQAPKTIDLLNPKTSDLSTVAILTMAKLLASMIKHQEAALKFQKEKGDSRMTSWSRLPKIHQNAIVFAGVEDLRTTSEEPTEEMLSILSCKNDT